MFESIQSSCWDFWIYSNPVWIYSIFIIVWIDSDINWIDSKCCFWLKSCSCHPFLLYSLPHNTQSIESFTSILSRSQKLIVHTFFKIKHFFLESLCLWVCRFSRVLVGIVSWFSQEDWLGLIRLQRNWIISFHLQRAWGLSNRSWDRRGFGYRM